MDIICTGNDSRLKSRELLANDIVLLVRQNDCWGDEPDDLLHKLAYAFGLE